MYIKGKTRDITISLFNLFHGHDSCRQVLERLRVELDQQLHRLHDSLNRLFDGGTRPEDETNASVENEASGNTTGNGSGSTTGSVVESTLNNTAISISNTNADESGANNNNNNNNNDEGDSRIITVVNPNYRGVASRTHPLLPDATREAIST